MKRNTRKFRLALTTLTLVALLLAVFGAVSVWAATIYVPADYATIQGAINAASPGDTVIVAAGTYNEYILIDKALTVKSTDGAKETTIDGIGFRYMVKIYSSDVTFEGFTVTNPTYEGGADATGILIGAYLGEAVSSVYILNNIVTQVRSESGPSSMYGATGINIGKRPLANVVISGNTITDIKNPDGAPIDHTCGINVWDGAEGVVISNNTISDIKYNGIMLQWASNVLIENNNTITGCKTGIRVEPFEGATVSGLTVNFNNFADNSIQVSDEAEALVIEDVLANNIFDRAVVIDRPNGSLLHIIWSNIQDAIDAALSGDTINVAAGVYAETLVADKQLTLQGPGSASTIIDASGASADYGILLTAGGVSASQRLTIKGLTIKNSPSHGIKVYKAGGLNLDYVTFEDLVLTLNGVRGMEIHNDVAVSDMEIKNCEFVSNGHQGLRTASNVTVDGLVIADSKFNGNSYGIYLQGTINGVTILRSEFNNSVGGYGGYMTETGPLTNLVIEDSEFNNNVVGLMIWNEQDNSDITIRRTSFQNNGKWGVLIWGATLTDVLIEDSTVVNNDGLGKGYYGIDFYTYNDVMTNVAVHFTNITGHTVGGGVKNRNTVPTAMVDATNNWWGDPKGPYHPTSWIYGSQVITNPDGKGDEVSDYVLYDPWYRPTTPMASFTIDHAKIDFKKKPDDDKVKIEGYFELDLENGDGASIEDEVTLTISDENGDFFSQTILMSEKGKKGEKWEYKRPKDGEGDIKHMTINWKNGKFDIRMDKADLAGVTNPVTISIQIGDDVGSASILMREKKHHWDYKATITTKAVETDLLAVPGELKVVAYPNPIRDVDTATFQVMGTLATQVEEIRVQIYDLSGRLVWEDTALGSELDWHTDCLSGDYLANGIYLYRVQLRIDGSWISQDLGKIAVLR